jgi:hypothetical protein
LVDELDRTYREVAQRLPANPAVRFETVDGKEELILTPLDRLDEPPSLLQLRADVAARLPRVDLPEVLPGLPRGRISPTPSRTSPNARHGSPIWAQACVPC